MSTVMGGDEASDVGFREQRNKSVLTVHTLVILQVVPHPRRNLQVNP